MSSRSVTGNESPAAPAQPAPDEPVVPTDDVQGQSVAGFLQDHHAHVYLRIADLGRFRRCLAAMVPRLACADEVLDHNEAFRRTVAATGREPTDLSASWMNLALSAPGLRRLASEADVEQFHDEAFGLGLPVRAGLLGDPVVPGQPGAPDTWLVGGTPATMADAVVLLAADRAEDRDAAVAEMAGGADAGGYVVAHVDEGDNPEGSAAGREHFGFRDGISQPALRGRRPDGRLIAARELPADDPGAPRFARPGVPLIWPGQILLGQPPPDPRNPLRPAASSTGATSDAAETPGGGPGASDVPGPPWAANGSYVVLRRLRQDVAGFWRLVRGAAADLGVAPLWLASRLVGRWPDGAPVELAPDEDRPALSRANDFGFFASDAMGVRCPLAAHIRKVNPRDVPTEQGGANDTLTRLLLRRGVVYGPPLADPTAAARNDGVDRGLLFVGHMASITGQFEFIQSTWCNDVAKPEVAAGEDPLIGRAKEGVARSITLRHGAQPVALSVPRTFVTPTGGGYFFAPSLSGLTHLAHR